MNKITSFRIYRTTMILILILFPFYLLTSCDDDLGDHEIAGTWNLMSFECCDWLPEDYERSDITWEFNSRKHTVTISNNLELDDQSHNGFKNSGTYTYTINDAKISISYDDKVRNYDFLITALELRLSNNPESDGPLYLFER